MIPDSEIWLRLVLATIAGGFIGLEREVVHKPAGVRTHMLVCLGSAIFIIIVLQSIPLDMAGSALAGITTGIGFLGAGTIFKTNSCFWCRGTKDYYEYYGGSRGFGRHRVLCRTNA